MSKSDVRIFGGDCREVMRELRADGVRFDAIVTDPPYHLTSIVKRFGRTALSDNTDTSRKARERDGGAARLSRDFMGKVWDGGDVAQDPETWRACWRILKPGGYLLAMSATRTYHRMGCAIEDAGFEVQDMIPWHYGQGFPTRKTRLKPATEPICMARKPFKGSLRVNIEEHGVGGINYEECRVEASGESRERVGEESQDRRYQGNGSTNFAMTPGIRGGDPKRLWPANVIYDGSDEILEMFPKTKNRFFYCAKATRAERAFNHPTVKPVALMRYLVRLVTRPGALVLDPFAGTGQTGYAALLEGRRAVLIEREAEYLEGLRARFSFDDPPCRRRFVI